MLCQLSYAPMTILLKNSLRAGAETLPLQGSNLDFPDPESGVLPVTPRGSACPFPISGYMLHGRGGKERETGLEPATLSLGS